MNRVRPSTLSGWDAAAAGCLAFVAYTYAGYGLILQWRVRGRPHGRPLRGRAPRISVVIAAHNEEASIGPTLESILRSDYPRSLLEVLVVSDASTDGTERVVRSFQDQGVRLIRQRRRSGQVPSLRRARDHAQGGILLFADAGERFEPSTIRRLAAHFQDPRVGAVSGSKITRAVGTAVSRGDRAYTGYDARLRALESRAGASWVGCEGGIYAIRKRLFRPDFPMNIAADNALCYRLYEHGFLHRFDPEALVREQSSENLANEFRRKVRIIVTQIRGMLVFRRLFNPVRHREFVFQNASHKLFRWLAPFALIGLLGSTARSRHPVSRTLFRGQALFYGLAVAGMARRRRGRVPWLLSVPAYFTTVNAAAFVAWFQLFRDFSIWDPPVRDGTVVRTAVAAERTR